MNIGAAVLFDNEHFVFLFTNPLNTESAMKMHMAHVNRFSFNPAGETWYLICSCQPAAPRFSDHQPVNGICCLGHSCILPVAFGRARSCIKPDSGGVSPRCLPAGRWTWVSLRDRTIGGPWLMFMFRISVQIEQI